MRGVYGTDAVIRRARRAATSPISTAPLPEPAPPPRLAESSPPPDRAAVVHALPRIDAGLPVLQERELAPFRAAIAAGTRAVMSAHILVPALDPDRPATLSGRVLTGLLREELGYEGLIVTDGMEMQAIAATYGIERGSVLAIAAGADAICVGGGLADDEADTIVVEMGVPQAPPRGALHLATHGAARVCGLAAAEVIAGE